VSQTNIYKPKNFSWCVQNNFNSEPFNFKTIANDTWANDASKQPDWDGAACP